MKLLLKKFPGKQKFMVFSFSLLICFPVSLFSQQKKWEKTTVTAAGIAGGILGSIKKNKKTQNQKPVDKTSEANSSDTEMYLDQEILKAIKAKWLTEEAGLEKGIKIKITANTSNNDVVIIKGYTQNGQETTMFGFAEYSALLKNNFSGDINNDGIEDIIVPVIESGGGNSSWTVPYVFSKISGVWKFVTDETFAAKDSDLCSSVMTFKNIENGMVVAEMACLAENDPRCCPSLFYKTYFKLNNGKLQYVKKEKISKK